MTSTIAAPGVRHVFLRDVVLQASIGLYPHEHGVTQRVRINIDLGVEEDDDPSDEPGDHFTRAMRVARSGELARTAFARDETVARLGMHRVGILTRRDDHLGRRVRVLRTLQELRPCPRKVLPMSLPQV